MLFPLLWPRSSSYGGLGSGSSRDLGPFSSSHSVLPPPVGCRCYLSSFVPPVSSWWLSPSKSLAFFSSPFCPPVLLALYVPFLSRPLSYLEWESPEHQECSGRIHGWAKLLTDHSTDLWPWEMRYWRPTAVMGIHMTRIAT